VKIKKLETALQSLQKERENENLQFEHEIYSLSSELEQLRQRKAELSSDDEMPKKENMKPKGDHSILKSEWQQTQQREQLLLSQIENLSMESTSQGQLLKKRQVQLETIAAEMESILAISDNDSTKIFGTKDNIQQVNIKFGDQLNMKTQQAKLPEE
jgi:chromosome segregation ATPase